MSTGRKYKILSPKTDGWHIIEEGGMFFRPAQWGKWKYSLVRTIKESQKGFLQVYFDKGKHPMRVKEWEKLN